MMPGILPASLPYYRAMVALHLNLLQMEITYEKKLGDPQSLLNVTSNTSAYKIGLDTYSKRIKAECGKAREEPVSLELWKLGVY